MRSWDSLTGVLVLPSTDKGVGTRSLGSWYCHPYKREASIQISILEERKGRRLSITGYLTRKQHLDQKGV